MPAVVNDLKEIRLDGVWDLGFRKKNGNLKWIKAHVPGDVHLDLIKADIIDDPLFGKNIEKCLWISEVEWHYKKEFYLGRLEKEVVYEITFYGLDTTCIIYLNGQEIGRHNNMFIPYQIDVTKHLATGKNILLVRIDSGIKIHKDKDPVKIRRYIRKAQFSFGWDWAPRLLTCGIWRSVILRKHKVLALRDTYITSKLDKKEANIEIGIEIEKFIKQRTLIDVVITIGKNKKKLSRYLTARKNLIKQSIKIKNPLLWWPIPFGKPNLYDISIEIYKDNTLLGSYQDKFGIREIRLEQKKLSKDEKGFCFVVNGKRIYAKGANWVPADSILARVNGEKYKKLIQLAKQANINMLRVWGGGIYEDKLFYRLCDEAGIMIWQDFMFACSAYPNENKEFLKNIRREAEIIVKQLRNHPSIVVWCGNNENEKSRIEMEINGKYEGWNIYHKILPGICKRLDPGRIYWPGSYYGGDDPNCPEQGDRHSWLGVPDYRKYINEKGKFISEFYAFAPPIKETIKKSLPQDEMYLDSPSWKFHDNRYGSKYFRKYFETEFLKVDKISFDDYLLYYQLYQAEAYKYAIECFRRRKFICSGSLLWMYNDSWPTTGSWTIVDYYLNKPPAYYYVKRAQSHLLLSFKEEKNTVSIWVVNDYLKEFKVVLIVKHMDFIKGEIKRWSKNLIIKENFSEEIMRINLGDMLIKDKSREYLYGELKSNHKKIAENLYFFENIKTLSLPKANISKRYKIIDNSKAELILKSNVFAYMVKISNNEQNVNLRDNYFSINPGDTMVLAISGQDITLRNLEKLKVRALNSSVQDRKVSSEIVDLSKSTTCIKKLVRKPENIFSKRLISEQGRMWRKIIYSQKPALKLDKKEHFKTFNKWMGENYYSVSIYSAWDNKYFYLAIAVKDKEFYQPFLGPEICFGDSIELALDPYHLHKKNREKIFECCLALGSRGSQLSIRTFPHELKIKDVKKYRLYICRTDQGSENGNMNYEFAIPWRFLLENERPYIAMQMGISMIFINNNAGNRGWAQWGGGIFREKDGSLFNHITLCGDG